MRTERAMQTQNFDNRELRIIGIGSPFGGDRVGLHAIERLRKEPRLTLHTGQLTFVALDRPGSSLLKYFEDVGSVILIDAMQSGLSVGTVQRLEIDNLIQQGSFPSSHNLGVAETLALADALGALPQQLMIYGIESGIEEESSGWYENLLSLLLNDISLMKSSH